MFDQQGEPAGRDQFPTLCQTRPSGRDLLEQAQDSESKEVGKPGSQKHAVPALCSRSCRDRLPAAPLLRDSASSTPGPSVRQPRSTSPP